MIATSPDEVLELEQHIHIVSRKPKWIRIRGPSLTYYSDRSEMELMAKSELQLCMQEMVSPIEPQLPSTSISASYAAELCGISQALAPSASERVWEKGNGFHQ